VRSKSEGRFGVVGDAAVAKSRLPRTRFIPAARGLTRPRGSFVPARGSLDTMACLDQKQTLLRPMQRRRGKGTTREARGPGLPWQPCGSLPRRLHTAFRGDERQRESVSARRGRRSSI
jgi:hypothetical protein